MHRELSPLAALILALLAFLFLSYVYVDKPQYSSQTFWGDYTNSSYKR
jgi:hypothetical protein